MNKKIIKASKTFQSIFISVGCLLILWGVFREIISGKFGIGFESGLIAIVFLGLVYLAYLGLFGAIKRQFPHDSAVVLLDVSQHSGRLGLIFSLIILFSAIFSALSIVDYALTKSNIQELDKQLEIEMNRTPIPMS